MPWDHEQANAPSEPPRKGYYMYHFHKLFNYRIYFSLDYLIDPRFHGTHFPFLSMETKEELVKVQTSHNSRE